MPTLLPCAQDLAGQSTLFAGLDRGAPGSDAPEAKSSTAVCVAAIQDRIDQERQATQDGSRD
ncbi:hypothetical protein PHYSODRAFT_326269 [Phytophthora sojae]|uniref:Uncharacterized protein n=1 Tax=Phytophthora sojae (strain P6497) TaxID=1094619 RepID=G4Z0C7_PHYSP|nr:hypothetical protein PHYSODRAFT_326269 [Phytophthora sojae]EGZ25213.1 hypothetical protein PHYSODRAFT_326269 [Phytophthora sojae]|eukprot:XP_009520501.1 hypothetical protein PHYSODRAFT_326269 [Phytophthora sojae]